MQHPKSLDYIHPTSIGHYHMADKPYDSNLRQWYVMAAFRRELIAEEMLKSHGFTVFLPKISKTIKEPHRRPKEIVVPAISTYVFVNASWQQLMDYKQFRDTRLKFYTLPTDTSASPYLTVPDRQMDDFMKVWNERHSVAAEITTSSPALPAGTRVRVTAGPLEGIEGVCLGASGRRASRLLIQLPGLLSLTATLPPSLLQPI